MQHPPPPKVSVVVESEGAPGCTGSGLLLTHRDLEFPLLQSRANTGVVRLCGASPLVQIVCVGLPVIEWGHLTGCGQ